MDEGSLALLKECLSDLVESGIMVDIHIDALAHLLSGAMDEAAVWIAQSENPDIALDQAQNALEKLLSSLKKET